MRRPAGAAFGSPHQTNDELGDALLTGRTAVTSAANLLEGYLMARRTRAPGERMDRVGLDPTNQQPQNFDSAIHTEHAARFCEGLALFTDAAPEQRAPLEEDGRAHGRMARPSRSTQGKRRAAPTWRSYVMTDSELAALRGRAESGDTDAVDELVQLAAELGDLKELRRLAEGGSSDAVDELIQLAAEQGDLAELRRLADAGNPTATDQLVETATELDDLDELRRLAAGGNVTAAEQLAELTAD
ncbi:hypothetical protein OG496_50790 [Streptomyces sp. NBC_00988]|uniref:hypothetical protein n=1 Tax=Streptomyces sp. NBC_00988 TaxID=2903704 RepID=UPI0038696F93|nr:hypothetical protein OG496_50790 [Streptomyces sp. NBC_00988]